MKNRFRTGMLSKILNIRCVISNKPIFMAGLLWKKTAQGVKAHYLWAESGEYNAAFTRSQAESRQERLLDGTGKTTEWQDGQIKCVVYK